ncbi:F-box/WD-40 repeat-containing protein At3g52030 isoform X2 [Phoenix dactylifera]|uniref:F-box/WD-40 repeat-containing protein At3g52030 isoform X2 n=1 Tax=Phoenix dactylifera TaxID=42345 RepID=A0A8B9B0U5_PHODC|nr:F-box/WD-40 repeat-containing protein At3g52030 isoform X2 [Phoenix dactylifera]
MEASGRRYRSVAPQPASGRNRSSIHSLGTDLLCAIFSRLDLFVLVRCSVVCKSWNNVIYQSSLMRDLYYKKNPRIRSSSDISIPLETSMKIYLEELAMEQHRLALTSGSAEVHQWTGHPVRYVFLVPSPVPVPYYYCVSRIRYEAGLAYRVSLYLLYRISVLNRYGTVCFILSGLVWVNICRMKRGVILTGVGDKVLRLWSAESCKYLDEYSLPDMNPLVDCDFDESKIVGMTSAQLCIWRRRGQRSIFQLREAIFQHGLCMRYVDPEAVIGCDDGRARIFDMYSGSCSRIIRMHSGPVTCLATDDQLILGGSTFGSVTLADLSSGERLGFLKSSFSPTGMKSMCFNPHSFLLFAGSTAGYAHCWDLRTLRPLWEVRASSNVIYATQHLSSDTSTLVVGGLDGVLRILNQSTGEIISSLVVNASLKDNKEVVEKKASVLSGVSFVESIPRCLRPPITCLAVGMRKVVTTHNEKFVRVWRFHE